MRALDYSVPFFDLLLSVQPLLIGLSLLTDENALPGFESPIASIRFVLITIREQNRNRSY